MFDFDAFLKENPLPKSKPMIFLRLYPGLVKAYVSAPDDVRGRLERLGLGRFSETPIPGMHELLISAKLDVAEVLAFMDKLTAAVNAAEAD